jgi:hypothetical protein
VNETVSELVCSQACEAEFGILNRPANRCALRREQHTAEGNATLLPPCRDLQEISVLRQQDAAKGRRSLQQFFVGKLPCRVGLGRSDIEQLAP